MSEKYTGNNITIENFGYNKANINIKGNAEQETRSGKNLFNINGEFTKNGSDTSHSVDGNTLTVEGKWYVGQVIDIEANTDYYMSFTKTAGDIRIYTVDLQTSLKTFNASGVWNSGDYTQIALLFNSGANGSDSATATFTNVQFGKGSTATEYEAYGASPSPDYPSKVVTVGQNVNRFNWETITLNKTLNNAGTFSSSNYNFVSDFIEVKPNTEYTVNDAISCVFEFDENKTIIKELRNSTTGGTVTTSVNTKYLVVRNYYLNGDLTKLAKTGKLVEGTKVGGYSPYGQGSVEIDVVNKNYAKIIPNQTLTATGITVTTNEDQSITMNGTGTGVRTFKITDILESKDYVQKFEHTKRITPKGDYQVALEILSGTLGNYFTWGVMYTDGTYTDRPNKISSDNVTVKNKEISFIYIYQSSKVFNNFIFRVSIQDINNDGIYVPHKSKKIILPIQKEFVKIGDIEDTFIKQDDKWYEAHYSPKFVFDGTGSWTYDAERYRFYRTIPKSIYAARAYALSSYFKNGNTETENNTFNVGTSQIFFRNENITSTANWKAWLAEQYANGTPLETYYVRETPELIECTPAQENVLNQLENIQLYEGVNNIMSTSSINPDLDIIITKVIEDYMCYISTAGKFVIPDSKIEYLIDFNESNIPTMPEATESSVRAAGRDGDIVLATTYEPIPLNIVCYTEDNLTLLEKVEEEKKVNKFLNSIKNRTIDLAIEKDNKYYNVKYSGALTTINFPKHLKFAIPLKSSASYGKDLIQKSIVGSGKGESETIEATGATFVIRGPAIKPIISFNDYSMEYNIDILEGARVEIDSNKSTATHVNSDGIRTNVMKHYNHQFPKIENGINELKILSGLDDDMNVSVVWNDLKL